MSKISAVFALIVTLAIVTVAVAERADETEAITATALDYGQGWYDGDAERMERAVHPDLAKRILMPHPRSGKGEIKHMGAMTLVQSTRKGWGKKTPEGERKTDVTILEVYGNVAVVKLEMHDWVDFMHMSRIDGHWVIVNVMWEFTPGAKESRGISADL